MSHIPVLLKEVIEVLDLKPGPACRQAGNFFIDGTLGGGGHAAEIIKRISPNGMFLGIDQDSKAIKSFKFQVSRTQFWSKAIMLISRKF